MILVYALGNTQTCKHISLSDLLLLTVNVRTLNTVRIDQIELFKQSGEDVEDLIYRLNSFIGEGADGVSWN
jgi:hypothetical protein